MMDTTRWCSRLEQWPKTGQGSLFTNTTTKRTVQIKATDRVAGRKMVVTMHKHLGKSWCNDALFRPFSTNSTTRPYRAWVAACSYSSAGSIEYERDYKELKRLLSVDEKREILPPPLPKVPASASLADVMPWLIRLALGEQQLYWRVGAAFAALIISKGAGILAPLYFKSAVDNLPEAAAGAMGNMFSNVLEGPYKSAIVALLLSGICRAASQLSKELQHPLFTPVSQAAGRRVSFQALAHVLFLDMAFHLNRNTGALSRMLERGARSVSMIFRAVVFTLAPTAVELIAVCVLLARSFDPKVSVLVIATFLVYISWTVGITWVRYFRFRPPNASEM